MDLTYVLITIISMALIKDYFEIKKLKKDVKRLLDEKRKVC